jgi:hypothetical protein
MNNNSNLEIIDLITDDEQESILDINFIPSKLNEKNSFPVNDLDESGEETISQHSQDSIMMKNLISSLETPLDRKNKGYRILEKFGYRDGGILGKNKKGLQIPINLVPLLKNIKGNKFFTKKIYNKKNYFKNKIDEENKGSCIFNDVQSKLNLFNKEKIFLCDILRDHFKFTNKYYQKKENSIILNCDDLLSLLLNYKKEIELNSESNYNSSELQDLLKKFYNILSELDISKEDIMLSRNSFNKLKRFEYNIENIVDLLKYLKELINEILLNLLSCTTEIITI